MSVAAYLVCGSRKLTIGLGKRLHAPGGRVIGFSIGEHHLSDDSERTKALWKFLADTAGAELVVKYSDDEDFETIAEYREIGGWVEDGGIPFEDYLRDGVEHSGG